MPSSNGQSWKPKPAPASVAAAMDAESERLAADARRDKGANWKRWGPYLSERQWGTVREDYSADGDCWNYFPHEQARSRAYRWGEDGLLGICDRECRLCLALALWNGKDPILKERLFGLTGPQGNHGEDVKEEYFYLDSTPTHSYMKALYKYPQAEFPYQRLVDENHRRGREEREFELADTGVFDDGRYFDVQAEYAKGADNDVLARFTVTNRGPDAARVHLLPQLWFRNGWSWGCTQEGCESKPRLHAPREGKDGASDGQAARVVTDHPSLGRFHFHAEAMEGAKAPPELLFTENETNVAKVFNAPSQGRFFKDGINERVVAGRENAVNPAREGTKVAAWYTMDLPPGQSRTVRLRLFADGQRPKSVFGPSFESVFAERIKEADAFFAAKGLAKVDAEVGNISRQAYASLLWSKQFYYYVVKTWLDGDPTQPAPPKSRKRGRNSEWTHLFNRDVVSMPDKWEYPWYAAWDLAFHMIPFSHIDPNFAKEQLILFLREWYMHPSGQLPAYEFALGDVNPPVHAWACWRVYKKTGPRGRRDVAFLARAFHKLMINFTWWVNRKDPTGKNLFAGGFLGLDNIGVFDRNRPLPSGIHLEQADGTAWMAFCCGTMLSMALELARHDPVYEDVASKFFEHFVAISDAINTLGGTGLWDETDGFYYDQIWNGEEARRLRVRSLVGVIPLLAVEVLEDDIVDRLPGFKKRMEWFLKYRPDLARHIAYMQHEVSGGSGQKPEGHRLLAIPSRERLTSALRYLLDENEFLSPFGIRSLSRIYQSQPFETRLGGETFRVEYAPGESTTSLFGGNSNWRGPIWMPLNFLIIEALERYDHFYGQTMRVECPTGSGRTMSLAEVADELRVRLLRLFLPGENGVRTNAAENRLFENDPRTRDLVLFHEHFHGDTGRGLGATHQTGWTALIATLLRDSTVSGEQAAAKPASGKRGR